MQRKIRVLVGKPGLDGHDRGAKVVAAALRDAGMEVIYTGLHQTSEQIVEAALQEDVDVVALSILSGAHMTQFPEVHALLKDRGLGDRLLTGGGIIPPEDMETLAQQGVGRLFGPGASTQDIVEYIRSWFAGRYGADALLPLPPPREIRPMVPASAVARAVSRDTSAYASTAGRAPKRAAKTKRKAATRGLAPSRASSSKTTSKKSMKRAKPKRAASKRVTPKRSPAKRAASKRATSKRPSANRTAVKRVTAKRPTPKRAVPKRPTSPRRPKRVARATARGRNKAARRR